MKKFLPMLGGAFASLGAFAEGATNTGTAYTGSTAESIVSQVSGTMTNFLSGAAPTIATIVVAGIAIWAGIALVGILKKAFAVGKGR